MSLPALAVGLRLCDRAARHIKVNEVHPPPFRCEMKETSLSGHPLCVRDVRASACSLEHMQTPEDREVSLSFHILWSLVWG